MGSKEQAAENSTAPRQGRTEDATRSPEAGGATSPQEPAVEGTADLEERLTAAERRATEHWEQYLRAAAELENVRKRAARDVEQAHRYALERFAGELLAVKDSLEMGLEAADAADAAALREGLAATLRQLAKCFEDFDVTEIAPLGETFDPRYHEAMATQPSDEVEPETVLQVVQKGYRLADRLLRPARVIVARPAELESGT